MRKGIDVPATIAPIDASLQGFSIFIGLGIHNCMSYEEAIKLNARQQVALEVLAYHASSTIEETVEFMVSGLMPV